MPLFTMPNQKNPFGTFVKTQIPKSHSLNLLGKSPQIFGTNLYIFNNIHQMILMIWQGWEALNYRIPLV